MTDSTHSLLSSQLQHETAVVIAAVTFVAVAEEAAEIEKLQIAAIAADAAAFFEYTVAVVEVLVGETVAELTKKTIPIIIFF